VVIAISVRPEAQNIDMFFSHVKTLSGLRL
jgi:hypothetical protein